MEQRKTMPAEAKAAAGTVAHGKRCTDSEGVEDNSAHTTGQREEKKHEQKMKVTEARRSADSEC